MDRTEYTDHSESKHEYIKHTGINSEYYLSLKSEHAINTALGWHGGKMGKYRFEVNVSQKSSGLGINNGKIWKLCVWDGEKGMANGCVVIYDGGWQIRPNKELEPYIKHILKIYD